MFRRKQAEARQEQAVSLRGQMERVQGEVARLQSILADDDRFPYTGGLNLGSHLGARMDLLRQATVQMAAVVEDVCRHSERDHEWTQEKLR
ncbi:hypothetical protein [Myceligenerans xiligouense]|uniref:Uncharacterized protein n=1 Tax=Myceligenerans xiligouense TaxID=253184 RepID=A0A3N4YKN2_9MICO|nr:hypothetical protein [Myceligenerans xiligouense]RPF21293.1 hypothetical protein EDD34_1918 [Myceligenerans xiligouense]